MTFLLTGVFAGAFMSSEHQMIARHAPDAVLGRVFGLKDSLDAVALCARVRRRRADRLPRRCARRVRRLRRRCAARGARQHGLLLRAGVVSGRRIRFPGSAAARRSQRIGGFGPAPVEIGETAG